jgi:hypothetical protein
VSCLCRHCVPRSRPRHDSSSCRVGTDTMSIVSYRVRAVFLVSCIVPPIVSSPFGHLYSTLACPRASRARLRPAARYIPLLPVVYYDPEAQTEFLLDVRGHRRAMHGAAGSTAMHGRGTVTAPPGWTHRRSLLPVLAQQRSLPPTCRWWLPQVTILALCLRSPIT